MLDTLRFDNRFTRELPADPQPENFRRQVVGACFSRVQPTPVSAPRLIAVSADLAAALDMTPEACASPTFLNVFSGNVVLTAMDPHAMCYGGHQFGNWAGQLGDGRAINLGEILNQGGERWCLQLKGAGPTPYSRSADGLAVLRSSIREFLCSEAMFHLGVPTTRALSLVATGERVMRDMFYDGHPKAEPGAIVCRVAPSFLRFGNFEIFAARGDKLLLQRLVDYTIATYFPELGPPSVQTTVRWFEEVCARTMRMIVHWMRVGFVHGVMNTDNMSILGLTIDYGPYGWLEDYDPDWTPNTTDAGQRRYRFGQQADIALWNLTQLANAIYPLVGQAQPLEAALMAASDGYVTQHREMLAAKLGFDGFVASTDEALIAELSAVLRLAETDMTLFFRALGDIALPSNAPDDTLLAAMNDAYYAPGMLMPEMQARTAAWLRAYLRRRQGDGHIEPADLRARMNKVNPKYVLRNYLAQLAIDQAERGDFSEVSRLLDVLRHPYDEQPGRERYAGKRPEWARQRAGCSMLSCSS